MAGRSRALSFTALLALAWALTAAYLFAQRWPELALRLFDADDAMRLVQVRDFIAGRGWFDLHDARINPPAGYDTHWSRLLDAGLAALAFAFLPFTSGATAELLMRAVWPLLWLFVAMASAAALAWRIGGRNAALIALVLSAFALPAFQHFKPGRIDHHNVQIALAVAVVAAAAWADRSRRAAILAGLLTGLALAVGMENVVFIALAGAALAIHALIEPKAARVALKHYGLALALSTLVAFFVSVPPSQWLEPACDAIAINWALPVVMGGIGLGIAAARSTAASARPLLAFAAVGAIALLAFLVPEPRCVLGPFALADDTVKLLWLDSVDETETLIEVVRSFPMTAAWLAAFPLVALAATVRLMRDPAVRRDTAVLLTAAALTLAFVLTIGAVKLYAYAMWFGIAPVAALVARITASTPRITIVARLAAAILLAPTIVTGAAILLAQAAGGDADNPGMADRAVCTRNVAYDALSRLPPGLVATDLNYAPFILALTPHSVVAAPYHRLTSGILEAHTIVNGSADEAHDVVRRRGINYIAICGRFTSTGVNPAPGTLWAALRDRRPPEWLTPVAAGNETTFAVYRVR